MAVWPPPSVIVALGRLDRPASPGVRWTTPDQWHVTLRFLGHVADDLVEDGKGALARLDPSRLTRPVTAVAGPGVTRLGASVWNIAVGGLDQLAAAVAAATADIGEAVGTRPFRGHLTLARVKPGAPPVPGNPFLASWPVDEVTMVASTRHPAGARYQVLSRVALDRAEGGC